MVRGRQRALASLSIPRPLRLLSFHPVQRLDHHVLRVRQGVPVSDPLQEVQPSLA
jgi:hypothetical protein